MGKGKWVTAAICLVFIVLSGIFYIKQDTGGSSTSFVKNVDIADSGQSAVAEDKKQDIKHNTIKENPEEDIKETVTEEVVVYICGAVKRPGVYKFKTGGRLYDAVKAAGGFRKKAARSAVNLARFLDDSEQIIIPSKKQAASYKKNNNNIAGTSGTLEADGAESVSGGLVNINTASREGLMGLPGIGGSKADAIIEYRSSNKFNSIEDIKNVSGIKDGVFNQLKSQITV